MEHIPRDKKIIEIAIYVSSPNNVSESTGHRIMLLVDKTTACGDVLAIAVDAVNAATGPASGV